MLKVALLDGKIKKFKVDSLSNFLDFYSKVNEQVENISTYTIHCKDEEEDVVLLDDDESLEIAPEWLTEWRYNKTGHDGDSSSARSCSRDEIDGRLTHHDWHSSCQGGSKEKQNNRFSHMCENLLF